MEEFKAFRESGIFYFVYSSAFHGMWRRLIYPFFKPWGLCKAAIGFWASISFSSWLDRYNPVLSLRWWNRYAWFSGPLYNHSPPITDWPGLFQILFITRAVAPAIKAQIKRDSFNPNVWPSPLN